MKNHGKFIVFLLLFTVSFPQFVSAQQKIQLEDIWLQYKFYPQNVGGFHWMNDDNFYMVLEKNQIVKYAIKDRKPAETLVDGNSISESPKILSYEFNADETATLLVTKSTPIYRHSSKDICKIYDLKSKKISSLYAGKEISLPKFSPDGKNISFVFENNLYVQNIASGAVTQVTKDGKYNKIINGMCDWVYEEEFGFPDAHYWNKTGSKIAFYRFDESTVKQYSMPIYNGLYPEQYTFKYPKAGEENSVVEIYTYDLNTKKTVKMDIGTEKDQYIPKVRWTKSENDLAIFRLNRLQNQLDVLMVDANNGTSKTILQEKSDTYVQVEDQKIKFLNDGKRFLWLSENSGFNHIYLHDISGKQLKQITSGKWEITEINEIDLKNETIYYTSTEEGALNRSLFKIQFNGKKKTKLSSKTGWNSATFSKNFSFFVNTYTHDKTPPITTLNKIDGKEIAVLSDNQALNNKLKNYNISYKEFFTFKTEENVDLNGWMIKPKDFDANKKYPVLMYVYGGPGSQEVKHSWDYFNFFWYQMLADKGYIVACVDNRGTGGRGKEFRDCTYKNLGKLETEDQIQAAKYLAKQTYVDEKRIGIWGWSFGGYMTTLCLTKGAKQFSTGIAVAPVTNWKYYDTIYTERYLQTPQLNENGYDDNSPINFADKLVGNYMIVHGSADDNVHMQNSMEMINALINNNKEFEMAIYPNKNHSIFGGYARYHLYNKMTKFITENL